MIDRAASVQPAGALKQQVSLVPCKGRGRHPAPGKDRACLPAGSAGSILGKVMSTTDYWNTRETNKQTNLVSQESRGSGSGSLAGIPGVVRQKQTNEQIRQAWGAFLV